MQAVLGPVADQLQNLIQEIQDRKGTDELPKDAGDAAAATSVDGQIKNAPPSQSFMNLKTIALFRSSLDDFWKCQSAAELKEKAARRAVARKPITELCQARPTGLKELKNGIGRFRVAS